MITARGSELFFHGCQIVVRFDGEKCDCRKIVHAKAGRVLNDALFIAVGSLKGDIVPNGFVGLVLPDCHFDPVQSV